MDSAGGGGQDRCLSSSVGLSSVPSLPGINGAQFWQWVLGKMSSKKEYLVWSGYSCGLRESGF